MSEKGNKTPQVTVNFWVLFFLTNDLDLLIIIINTRYNWSIIESDVKYHKPTTYKYTNKWGHIYPLPPPFFFRTPYPLLTNKQDMYVGNISVYSEDVVMDWILKYTPPIINPRIEMTAPKTKNIHKRFVNTRCRFIRSRGFFCRFFFILNIFLNLVGNYWKHRLPSQTRCQPTKFFEVFKPIVIHIIKL